MVSVYTKARHWTAALALCALAAATPAHAGVVFESAAYSGVDNGDYAVSSDSIFSAAFQLTSTTAITGVGGQFGAFDGSAIFAAIVPLASLTAFPSASSDQIASISLANAVFSVPSSGTALDFVEPLNVTLGPGTYGVIFGAGQFGSDTSGFAGLGDSNTPAGSPNLFRSFFGTGWDTFSDPGVRLVVEGNAVISPVPLPAGLPLFAASLGLLGFFGWQRQRKSTDARAAF